VNNDSKNSTTSSPHAPDKWPTQNGLPRSAAIDEQQPAGVEADLINGTIHDVVAALRIDKWDAIIVGDGSGSGWSMGAGWACVVVMRNGLRSPLLSGAFNTGTVNIAELMAGLQGLMWLDEEGNARQLRRERGGFIDVHIVSDSELTVNQGNLKAACRGVTRTLWKSIREYEREGYRLHYHWYPRDKIQLNVLCDHASRQARLAVEKITVPSLLENDRLSTYHFNPVSRNENRSETLGGSDLSGSDPRVGAPDQRR
jgi:ribonuclease HI